MAFTDAAVGEVKDKLEEIQEARAKLREQQLRVGEGRTGLLTDAERDTVRDRLRTRVQTLRAQIVTEVASWS
jgi:hypothetical protein